VACNILSIPASSTPSERLFSQSGLLSSHRFSRTTPKNLELRVLAKVNFAKDCNSFIFVVFNLFFLLFALFKFRKMLIQKDCLMTMLLLLKMGQDDFKGWCWFLDGLEAPLI